MARTVTLSQLRTDARLWANMSTSGPASAFIDDTALNRIINLRLTELHELLLQAQGHDFASQSADTTVALTSGTASYALPAGFMSVQGVWIDYGGQDIEIVRSVASPVQSVKLGRVTWSRHGPKGYRINGDSIILFPTPNTSEMLSVRYTPAFSDLAADGDTYDGVNGWEKLVTMGAAVDMLMIEGRNNPRLEASYTEQLERIQNMAHERQQQDPLHVRDVESEMSDEWPPHPDRWTS